MAEKDAQSVGQLSETDKTIPATTLCKARLHGKPPARRQERPFYEYLSQLEFSENNAIDVWFTQLLSTNDTDAVIVCRNIGLFVIELKYWSLGAIRNRPITAVEGIEIDEHVKKSTTLTPWQQAFNAVDALSKRLESARGVEPILRRAWISGGAALFNISRSRFFSQFSENGSTLSALDDIANGVIFAEDLDYGTAFIERLKYVKAHPLYRKTPNSRIDRPNLYSSELVNALEHYINWKLIPVSSPTKSDLERLRKIERDEERALDQVDASSSVLCSGFAGTGKTVLGLQYALRLRTPTLFTCFNKVLATDIRRLIGFSNDYSSFPFDVYDIFDLVDLSERRLELPSFQFGNDVDSDAKKRVDRIIKEDRGCGNRLARSWKLIIVDEAQDLKDYSWKLLDWLSASSSMFVIDGKRQQLYRPDRAVYLDTTFPEIVPLTNRKYKRRVFRTSNETFLLGQLFAESYPSIEKAQKLWQERYRKQYLAACKRNESQDTVDFELAREGRAPKLYNMAAHGLSLSDSPRLVPVVASLIEGALKKLRELGGTPSDILILVPFSKEGKAGRRWRDIAIDACKKVGHDYMDYTDKGLRRIGYSPDDVRVTTFHSSRGVEGWHSIVLGFECISGAAKEQNEVTANLGYITLTRSLFETDVLYCSANNTNIDVVFLEEVLAVTGF
jgi:hypothetical protein